MTAPTPLQLAAYVAGAVLVALGVWMFTHRPDPEDDPAELPLDGPPWLDALRRWRAGMTGPTRTVLGLCLALLGYHLAAWAGPEFVFSFRVPPERWWILVGAIVVAVLGSLAADRMESR